MAAKKTRTSLDKSASEIVHESLESLRDKLSHLLGDEEHNVLETIKYAASKVIHKAEKVLHAKTLKKTAKKAIRTAEKALDAEVKKAKSTDIAKSAKSVSAKRIPLKKKSKAIKKAAPKRASKGRS